MDLIETKLRFDHFLIACLNKFLGISRVRLSATQRRALCRTAESWGSYGRVSGGSCLVCGNGPSLNEIDFEEFSSTPSFAANYFFKHPRSGLLKPNFYFIIDSKIVKGIWPISMITQIFLRFPEVKLFLDVRWMHLEIMRPWLGDDRVFWVLPISIPHAGLNPRRRLDRPICGLNVVSAAITAATAMGFSRIGIAGVDGDGLFREILDLQSHFYKSAKDDSMKGYDSMVKSLLMSTESLWAWQGLVRAHADHGIDISNVCKGGIMDCMPRTSPSDFLATSSHEQ